MYPQGQTDQRSSLYPQLRLSQYRCSAASPTEGTGLLTGVFAQYDSIRADQKAASLQAPQNGGSEKQWGKGTPENHNLGTRQKRTAGRAGSTLEAGGWRPGGQKLGANLHFYIFKQTNEKQKQYWRQFFPESTV